MTVLYLDTECNGFNGELISMAVVSERDEWYGIFPIPKVIDAYVEKHVIPVLHIVPGVGHIHGLHGSFVTFLLKYDNPDIICDCFESAKHFFAMFYGKDADSSLYYVCRLTVLTPPPGQPNSDVPYNALANARALRHWHSNSW